jgi:hypothetical protein
MSYFYLQVDRLDGESACAFFYPMGQDSSKVQARLATYLDSYRDKGFRISHFDDKPLCKHATRKDGVKLELLVVMKETPLKLALNVEWSGDDENHATAH